MIHEALNALEEKSQEVIYDPTQNNAKGIFKAFGLGAAKGAIEELTILGAFTLLGMAAGAVINLVDKKNQK